MGRPRPAVKTRQAATAVPARASRAPVLPDSGPLRGRPAFLLGAMVLAYVAVYATLQAIRFRYYLYTDFDLAIFAQAVDGVLHGRLYSSMRGMEWLADHASLILFPLAPLYAVARHPMTLLVVQSAAQALGALPMFALTRRETGHTGLALVAAGVYLLQPALGYANLFEFHPELLATAPLLASFHFLRCGRTRPTLAWAGVALLCREDVALVVAMMAAYALTRRTPGRARLALGLLGAAALSAFVTWGVLRPAFFHGEADYARVYRQWGDSLGAVVLHMLRDPGLVVANLFSTPGSPQGTLIKQQFHLTLFLPLGMLSLLSPLTVAIAAPVFLEHLLSWRTSQHTILCQYTALQVPFVAAAAAIGMRNLLSLATRRPAASGGPRRAGAPQGPLGSARNAALVAAWALAASLGCQLWFGPLLSSGKFFITGTRGRHLPTAEERTLARHRDRLLALVPRRGAVVASFEFLNRLTARDSVHALVHPITGRYTASPRAYPTPEGVSALLADLAAPGLVNAVVPGTGDRLQDLVRRNRLVAVAAAGDLVLLARGARDTVALVTPGACAAPAGAPIAFDGQIAYLGGGLADSVGEAGGSVLLHTCWRRIQPASRFFQTRFELVDAAGRSVGEHRRDLGYLVWPPHTWQTDVAMREDYRLVLNDDLRPGVYRVVLRVGWRYRNEGGLSIPDDPARYDAARGIDLGRLRVASPGTAPRIAIARR